MNYYFRGVHVFAYDPQTKEMTIPTTDDFTGNNFNYCKFIPEDYDLLADFFQMAHAHAIGEITVDQLQDIEVN